MTKKLTLVAIFAHPDDEAFGTGGTLAKYANEGVDVHLVMATCGESGQIANPNIAPTQPMSLLREQELRRACEHFGVKQLHLLGYMDGQTAQVPPSEAVLKIVRLLRQLKPQVVISFGPEGVYGHFDHLVVHRWSSAAAQLAADSERWPQAGLPHRVAKFYHRATPQEQVLQMKERYGRNAIFMDGIPFPFVGYPMEQITTVIDVKAHAQAKLNGILCHASQLAPEMMLQNEDFVPAENPWFWQETFILAQASGVPFTQPGPEKETDLFAGVRS